MQRRIDTLIKMPRRHHLRNHYWKDIVFDVKKLSNYDTAVPPKTTLPMEEHTIPLSTILAHIPDIAYHQCITTYELHHQLTIYFEYMKIPHSITFDFASPKSLLQLRLYNTTPNTAIKFNDFMRMMIGQRYVKKMKQITSKLVEIHIIDFNPTPHQHDKVTPTDLLDITRRI